MFNKHYTSRVRQEFLDIDYLDQLSDKEKQFLHSFLEEYLGGNFQHSGKQLIKSKKKMRELWRENNSRNRDLYGLSKARGALFSLDEIGYNAVDQNMIEHIEGTNYDVTEDSMIDLIDNKINK
jgi:hypothetical protein